MFRKQSFKDLMQAIKSVEIVFVVNASSDWQKFENCLVKVHKTIVDQWELNKTITDVAKEVKRPKLGDKVSGEGSKCVHCGNLWNKTSTSLSKSRFTEAMVESRKYTVFLLFLFPEFHMGL
ncbi:hypothetical protein Tco_0910864 [Tanacetum coccineum]|uniref:Uncharacterized protein n=1 Tax=Tanacetum coccineum TaxID=301880 RepID=A0ABQ5CV34_9ASTR